MLFSLLPVVLSGILDLTCMDNMCFSLAVFLVSLYHARMYRTEQMPLLASIHLCMCVLLCVCGYQRTYAYEGISAGEMSPCIYNDDRSLSCNSIVFLDSFDIRTMER